jgi:putative alpha-1,2-mannosidase
MSAWYILSTMGFYQVAPGSNTYVFGTPRFANVSLKLSDGKTFRVEAENLSLDNYYIKEVRWNGQPYEKSYITHDMITLGGTLTFVMDSEPNKEFGKLPEMRPFSKIEDELMTAEQLMNK